MLDFWINFKYHILKNTVRLVVQKFCTKRRKALTCNLSKLAPFVNDKVFMCLIDEQIDCPSMLQSHIHTMSSDKNNPRKSQPNTF